MYDFFIAHASADAKTAERLFDLLSKESRVFLDTRCLKLGDQWDIVIPQAQRQSRVTVVIVSPRTDAAFYQQEEVAAAIELARRGEGHRVVPVYPEGPPKEGSVPPYGLRRLHAAQISKQFKFEDLARTLLAQLHPADAGAGSQGETLQQARLRAEQAVARATSPRRSPRAKPQSSKPPSPKPPSPKPGDPDLLLGIMIETGEPKLISDPDVKVVRQFGNSLPEGRARLDITEKGLLLRYTDGQRIVLRYQQLLLPLLKDNAVTILGTGSRIVFTSSGKAAAAHRVISQLRVLPRLGPKI